MRVNEEKLSNRRKQRKNQKNFFKLPFRCRQCCFFNCFGGKLHIPVLGYAYRFVQFLKRLFGHQCSYLAERMVFCRLCVYVQQ